MATKAKAKKKDKRAEPAPAGEVLTLAEAAAFLRVAEGAVNAEAESGRLPGRRLEEDWRFSRKAILEWLEKPQRPPVPPWTTNDETPEEQDAFIARLREIRKEWGTVGGDDRSETP